MSTLPIVVTKTRRLALCLISGFFLAIPQVIVAADKTWTGATNSNWNNNGNWSGNAPAGGDNAVFNSTFTNQPNVNANVTAGGVWFTGNIGQNTSFANNGTLTLNGNTINGTSGLGILVDNTNSFTLTINAALKLGGAQTWTNSSGNLLTIGSGGVNLNNKALTINGSGDTTISGVVSNGGGLTKSGSGTLTLSGTNTYTGGTTINGGTVVINSSSSLGNTTSGVTINAGTVEVSTGFSTTRVYTLGDTASAIKVDASQTFTISSILGGTGALNTTGPGTLVLSGVNTYTGGTNINAGILNLGGATALGVSGTISFGGGTLQYTSSNTTDYSSRFSGASNQAYSIDTNGQNVTFASALTSSRGSLTKLGSGTLTLSAANTYTGATTVSSGTLSLDSNGSTTARLANTSGITLNSGGTLLLANSSGTTSNDRINNSATMTLNGGTFNTGGLSEHGGSNNTAGIGALTLQTTSIIDMGSSASVIAFANSHLSTWSGTLKIYNWSGTPLTGGGTDQLFFGDDNTALTAGQLAQIQFYSGNGTGEYGAGALILANGEVVPIPEISTWTAGGLGLTAVCWHKRRCRIWRKQYREKGLNVS